MTILTTALPYANGALHIGHLYEWLLCDTWLKLYHQNPQAEPISWISGDDAHGNAISLSAQQYQTTPENWVTLLHQERLRQLEEWRLYPTQYGKTTDPAHHTWVQRRYLELLEKGYIVFKEAAQFFDEQGVLLFEREVRGLCPHCQAPYQTIGSCEACFATIQGEDLLLPKTKDGKEVTIRLCSLAHFQLDLVRTQVEAWIRTQALPEGLLKKLLSDLRHLPSLWCIERPGPYFGIPVPHREGFFYVWFDAVWGYESFQNPVKEEPSFVHCIGKDIVTFHAIWWIALRAALSLPLPKRLWVHGHVVNEKREKFSKSANNAPDLSKVTQAFSLDALRLNLVGQSGGGIEDIPYHEELIKGTWNKWAQLTGNTYRRLWTLNRTPRGLSENFQIFQSPYFESLQAVDVARDVALESGDFVQYRVSLEKGLTRLNQALSEGQWWKDRDSSQSAIQSAWDALLWLLWRSSPLLPEQLSCLVAQYQSQAELPEDLVFLNRL